MQHDAFDHSANPKIIEVVHTWAIDVENHTARPVS